MKIRTVWFLHHSFSIQVAAHHIFTLAEIPMLVVLEEIFKESLSILKIKLGVSKVRTRSLNVGEVIFISFLSIRENLVSCWNSPKYLNCFTLLLDIFVGVMHDRQFFVRFFNIIQRSMPIYLQYFVQIIPLLVHKLLTINANAINIYNSFLYHPHKYKQIPPVYTIHDQISEYNTLILFFSHFFTLIFFPLAILLIHLSLSTGFRFYGLVASSLQSN